MDKDAQVSDSLLTGRATIKDVAAEAGVSIGTVSRYINGLNIRVHNRLAVEAAIKKYNYRTDQFARYMKTGKSRTIGLIVSGYDEFSMGVLSSLVRFFQKEDYALITYHHKGESDLFDRAVEQLLDRNLDGLAMSGLECRAEQLHELLAQGKPVVMFNHDVKGFSLDKVLVKDRETSCLAISHLIEMKHRRIGIITGNLKNSTGVNRLEGYRQAHADHGLIPDSALIYEGDWIQESGYLGTKQMMSLPDPPTALFASNYLIAIGLLRALKEMKLRVPEDVSVISFDDTDYFSIANPAITAIAQSAEEVGKSVAAFLLDRLSGRYAGEAREKRIDCQFIMRESVRILD